VEAYRNKVSKHGDVFGLGALLYYIMEGRDRLQNVPESLIAASFRVRNPPLGHPLHDVAKAQISSWPICNICEDEVMAQVIKL
jgi:hypothetical protein